MENQTYNSNEKTKPDCEVKSGAEEQRKGSEYGRYRKLGQPVDTVSGATRELFEVRPSGKAAKRGSKAASRNGSRAAEATERDVEAAEHAAEATEHDIKHDGECGTSHSDKAAKHDAEAVGYDVKPSTETGEHDDVRNSKAAKYDANRDADTTSLNSGANRGTLTAFKVIAVVAIVMLVLAIAATQLGALR